MESEETVEMPSARRAAPRRVPIFYRVLYNVLNFPRRHFVISAVVVLVILAGGFTLLGRYTVYMQHPELSSQEKANTILTKVSQLIQLPQNETPSMAVITDASAAKAQQPFVANAVNNDVLIVYPNAGLAILYRPTANKLIAVGPVNQSTSKAVDQSVKPITTSPAAATSTPSTTHASSTSSK